MPLKYLSNFRTSLEMSLINCKIEIKLKWTKYYLLAVLGKENDNADVDSNNNIVTIKDTKLYLSVVTLSTEDNEKLLKPLSKGCERSVY